MSTPRLRLRVLGPLMATGDDSEIGLGGLQQRRLLAVLITEAPRAVPVDRLVEALWPDGDEPEGARRTVMTYVSRLRSALGEERVITIGDSYQLRIDDGTLDADRFETLVEQAAEAPAHDALRFLGEGLGLWAGRAFGELADEWYARPAAARLEELRLVAEERRVEAMLTLGEHDRAAVDLERLVAVHPLRERFARQLGVALFRSGRTAEALRALAAFRTDLVERAGLDPSVELVELEQRIFAGDQSVAVPGRRPLRGYVLGEVIGEGAFGTVHRATQLGVGREVAIKVIRPDLADDPSFVRRFEAEAQLVARLEHPHIVPLYDFWREPGGAYLVFRLLTTNAETILDASGPFDIERAGRLVEEIGGALLAAHTAGVVHRDVKPANVLYDDAGNSYLADFGIAVVDESGAVVPASLGSPLYASPEQSRDGTATAQSDLYAFGVTLWELLTGTAPFRGETMSTLLRQKMERPVPNLRRFRDDLPGGVDTVLQRATATNPRDRFGSMAEMVLAWRAAIGRSPAQAITDEANNAATPVRPREKAAQTLVAMQLESTNPYKGLRAFREADAVDFFGREALVDELDAFVAARRFVIVVGPSGSGKSSLLLAGLVPRMRRHSLVVTTLPGRHPFDELELALLRIAAGDVDGLRDQLCGPRGISRAVRRVVPADTALVVVVDQLEELWTLTDPSERDEFLSALADAVGDPRCPLRVVASLRADFYDRPLQHRVAGPLVRDATFAVTPMTPAEIERAITVPAAQVGVRYQPAVVASMVAETAAEPGSLPLAQFALTELYDQRIAGEITEDAYRATGGVAGALARRADTILDELTPDARAAARRLFLQLVTLGEGVADTRRRVRRRDLRGVPENVIQRFGEHRLLVFDNDAATREPTVEVAHEALLRHWPRFRVWLDADRDNLRLARQLEDRAAAWHNADRDPSELLRGARLDAALEWAGHDPGALTPTEQDFLAAGRAERDLEQQRYRRTRRRLQRLLAVAAVALVVALLAGAVALNRQHTATRQRDRASAAARAAADAEGATAHENLANESVVLRDTQRDLAALLAVEAYRAKPDAVAKGALLSTLFGAPNMIGYTWVPGAESLGSGVLLNDDHTAIVSVDGSRLRRVDVTTGAAGDWLQDIPATPAGGPDAAKLTLSSDGNTLAALIDIVRDKNVAPRALAVYDTATGRLQFPVIDLPFDAGDVAIDRSGSLIAVAGGADGTLIVYSGLDGHVVGKLAGLAAPTGITATRNTAGVTFASDGRIFLGSLAGPVRVIDPATFGVVATYDAGSLASNRHLQVSADNTMLVTNGDVNVARIDLPSGTRRWSLSPNGPDYGIACTGFAIDATTASLYCGDRSGRFDQRDLERGDRTARLDNQLGSVGDVVVSSDGRTLLAFGGSAPVITTWRLDGTGPITRRIAPGMASNEGATYGADGNLLLVVGNRVKSPFAPFGFAFAVVDATTGAIVDPLDGIGLAGWSAKPDELSAAYLDGTAGAYDVATHRRGEMAPQFPEPVHNAVVSKDGQRAYVALDDEIVTIDRSVTGRFVDPTIRIASKFTVNALHVTPDGNLLVMSTDAGTTTYDAHSGALVAGPVNPPEGTNMMPDGRVIGTDSDGDVAVYDPRTLQRLFVLPGTRGAATAFGLSDDGTILEVTGGDDTVTVYDFPSRHILGRLDIPHGERAAADIRLDGKELAVGGGALGIALWNLDPAAWPPAACRLAGRNLTRTEWTTYLGDIHSYHATCPEYPSN